MVKSTPSGASAGRDALIRMEVSTYTFTLCNAICQLYFNKRHGTVRCTVPNCMVESCNLRSLVGPNSVFVLV